MKDRLQSIDLIKLMAMCMIVGFHTFPLFIPDKLHIANIIYQLCGLGVPLFFMVSGYLLIGKNGIDSKYVLRKIFYIIRFVLIIGSIFWLKHTIAHPNEAIAQLPVFLFGGLVQQGQLGLFWFLGALIILYIALIPLNRLHGTKDYNIYILSVCLSASITISILNLGGLWNRQSIETNIPQVTRIYTWISYFMLGGLLKTKSFQVKSRHILLAIVIYLAYHHFTIDYTYPYKEEYFYCSIPTLLLTTLLFRYISNINVNSCIVAQSSSLFLPVYVLHGTVLYYFITLVPSIKNFNGGCLIAYMCVLLSSISLSLIIMRFDIAKNIFKI